VTSLLVSSVGGHLSQLHGLLPRLQGVDSERVWVTYDSPQSRSLLAEEQVIYLDYAGPRDLKALARHALVARALFKPGHPYSAVISTGSGIAVPFLTAGRIAGASCHYIESFTRSAEPSLTGKILSRVPGVALYTQYPALARPPWRYAGSLFDAFSARAPSTPGPAIRRVVVTLGTMRDYQFRRLVDAVRAILPEDAVVLWQVGCTDVSDTAISAQRDVPEHTLRAAISNADVVVAHAGCGSALCALECGKLPVLVPRSAARAENVDDHQALLASELSRRGLALVRDAEELTLEALQLAARSSVARASGAAAFQLAG
jgi:UDP-N-acetylglucosamine--N-acetylmuramyl-(pentapeptide) pyrophosphoryl-undecaprenol N-acetylglucosamine transferase